MAFLFISAALQCFQRFGHNLDASEQATEQVQSKHRAIGWLLPARETILKELSSEALGSPFVNKLT